LLISLSFDILFLAQQIISLWVLGLEAGFGKPGFWVY